MDDESLIQKIRERGRAALHSRLLHNLSPTQTIALSFCLIIFTGTLLLMLPISTRDGAGDTAFGRPFHGGLRHLCDRAGAV